MRIPENASILLDPPVDVDGGATTTPWVDMGAGKDLAIMITTGAIDATASCAVTLNQDKNGDGSNSKALAFDHYYTVDTTTGNDVPTKTDASTLTIGGSDDNKCFIIPVDAADVDVENAFRYVRAALADPSGSMIVGTNLVLTEKRSTDQTASV